MTRFDKFFGLKAITLTAALSMTAGLALAGDNNVSSDKILDALKPKPVTRGLSAGPQPLFALPDLRLAGPVPTPRG